MAEEEKLPKRVQDIIARVRSGERLCKSLRHRESDETEVVFYYEPSGKRCGPKSAEAACSSGHLRPLGDALFEDSMSQTWAAT